MLAFAVILGSFRSGAVDAFAHNEPNAAEIEAKVAAATGKLPAMERVTTTVVQHGETGIEIRIRSGDDYRVDRMIGTFATANGMVGGVRWEQNLNGITIADASDPGEPVTDSITTSVEHTQEPFERYILSKVNALGNGSREYIDPTTWQIVRLDEIASTGTKTTRFGRFAGPLGFFRAWHESSSDGHSENDSSKTIVSDVIANVTPAMLAIPKSRRTLVQFLRGHSISQLPVRMVPHRDRFIVRVTIGTRGLDLLLDSGCGGISLDRDVVKSLGLKETLMASDAQNAGRFTVGLTTVPEMDIGDLTLRDVVVGAIPDDFGSSDGVRVVGLLGFDFLAQMGLKLDYAHGSVTAYDPAVFVPPANPHVIVLAAKLGDALPKIPAVINGATGTRFVLDTGGIGATLVFDYFRRNHASALEDAHGHPQNRELLGVGGTIDTSLIQVATLKIGQTAFHDVNAFVVTTPGAYGSGIDGVIGPDVLRQFSLYLDFPQQRVFLDPN